MRFPFAPIVLAGLLAACSSGSDLFVTLPAHVPAPGSSALAQTSPGSISIALFDEQRPSGKTSGWIGERARLTASRAANAVYAVPPPGIAVRDALISEFRAAGWQVQKDAADKLDGQVSLTLTTSGSIGSTWYMTASAALKVHLTTPSGERSGTYQATCKDGQLAWPEAEDLAKTANRCLDGVIGQFTSDTVMARALGAP